MSQENNSITSLRYILFAQLERLKDPNENLEKEIKRASAIVSVSDQIVSTAKVELAAMQFTKQTNSLFLGTESQNLLQNDNKG